MSTLMHWEDFVIGARVRLGTKRITRQEILDFATEFDPQAFHLDEQAARETPLGGLAASGWHSCALLMRMICDGYLVNSTSLGSPGLDEVRWRRPVCPDDTLTGYYTCTEKRSSKSRPEVGICKIFYELVNQDDDVAMTWQCNQFFGRREAGSD